jgi:hypothetical protein
MALIPYQNFPPEWQPLIDKLFRWYNSGPHPVMACFNGMFSRGQKAATAARSFLKEIALVWDAFDSTTKAAWKSAGATCKLSGYNLFIADYAYRKKNSLSLPGTPSNFHQLGGLELWNTGGFESVQAIYRDIAVMGPIQLKISFKQDQNSAPTDYPFRIYIKASYFDAGLNKYDEDTFTAAAGNVDWNTITRNFGVAGRYYFEIEVFFCVDYYDAVITLDNFELSDSGGIVKAEYWNPKAMAVWQPDLLDRKTGWTFLPLASSDYFNFNYED